MAEAIKVSNLKVVLGGTVQALKGIDLVLSDKKIVGIIGPSGAGKTTLVRSIVGRQKINSGSITILDLPAGSPELRSKLNYMTQEVSVYEDLTVRQNLRYFATMHGIKRNQMNHLVSEIVNNVDLAKQIDQLVGSLSGGQKQRASLAIALIGEPKILVLDEPTVGLDPVLRDQIWQIFHRIKQQGTMIIITSHAMDEAQRCEDLVLIRDGEILAHGSPRELCDQNGTDTVEKCFLKLVGDKS